MAIDRLLRADICHEVRKALEAQFEMLDEQWISEKEVLAQFQMFTPYWLRRYGHTLPRTRAVVTDEKGGMRQSGWAYGKHQIQKMIMENGIKQLKVKCL